MDDFGSALRAIREESEYRSSRAFFNKNGGAGFFGCTYRHYLNVESGRALPGVKLVEKIAAALGLLTDRARARKFVEGYLRTLTRSEDMVHLIGTALSGAPEMHKNARSKLIDSMARVNQQHVYDLSREQSQWICKSAENYWTWTILSHDRNAWDAKSIAEVTGFPAARISQSMRGLTKLELAAKASGGKYRSPHAGKVFQHPESGVYPVGLESLRDYREAMAKKRGKDLMRYFFFSRGPEAELRQYFDYLIKSVQGAEVVSSQQHGEDTVFFEIETRVKRVLPF